LSQAPIFGEYITCLYHKPYKLSDPTASLI
jgi:hypothetical protein